MSDVVLVVEDDEDVRESLEILLARRGHQVVGAANGQDALDLIDADDPPCLIVLDLMMPVMDGWELRSRLLADPRLAPVPVILVSGVTDVHVEAQSLQAVECLKKPVDLRRLYDVVATHC